MSLQLAQPELSRWESIVNSLRVNELQSILQNFKTNKLGKKNDLVLRVNQLLRTPQHQTELIKQISNMSNRPRPAPYNAANSMANRGYPTYNQMNTHQGMYGNGGVTMGMYNSNNAPKTLRGLRPLHLPFYDLVATILEPVELSSIPSGMKTQQKVQIPFSIPQQFHRELIYRDSAKPLPRYELQLRFFHLPLNYHLTEQPDDFPPTCNVKIDDIMIVLPSVIPTNKPNVEAKRPSRPVNITHNCQPPRDSSMGKMAHRMMVEWVADRRSWAVAIYLVNRVTSDILRDRAVSNAANRQEEHVTRQQVIRRMTVGDDDGITMDQVRISLICPLGKTRMGIPARCRDCSHLQCFDLDLFLKMNEKRPTWKCGICSSNAPYGKLIIDGYFQNILREVTDVNEIELLTDGGYQKIQEEACDISDSDDDNPHTSGGDAKRPAAVGKLTSVDDIITIDSDDDEELQHVIAVSSADSSRMQSETTPRKPKEIVVIDLDDDTPPRPPTLGLANNLEQSDPLQSYNPASAQSTTSITSQSPPVAAPLCIPNTSSTQASGSWRNNPIVPNGNRATPTYNYSPQMNQPPFSMTQAMGMPNYGMWNIPIPAQTPTSFNFIGGNIPSYRNGNFTPFFAQQNDQQNRQQHFMQQQPPPPPTPTQTLADALQSITNQSPTFQQQNSFQNQ